MVNNELLGCLSELYGIPTLTLSFHRGKPYIFLVRVEVFLLIHELLRAADKS